MTLSTPGQSDVSLRRWSAGRLAEILVLSAVGWAVVAVGCLCVGSNGKFGWASDTSARNFRLEVVLISSLVGASLAAAGVVYQAILRNPLADPFLLGVSGGASLCAFAWRLPLMGALAGSVLGAVGQQSFAFVGAMAIVAMVLILATRGGRLQPITLLLAGVIMNSILGAIFLLLNTLFPDAAAGMGGAAGFLVGTIQTDLTRRQEYAAAAVAMAGFIAILALSGQLNVATLSEAEAESLGVRIQRLRWGGLIVASIVTAAAVSISGSIGFVGLICPHMARRLVGPDHRRLLPTATALGAALLAGANALSRFLAAPGFLGAQLPVGVLTALLGGPFFLLLLWESRRSGE